MALDWELKELDDFLGSAHVFSSAVSDVIEERLLAEVSGGLLTASQLKLLKLVAMADSHTIGDVAAFLGVSNAAASKAVDRLVRRNLLRRREDKKDRRAMHLSLPSSGRVCLPPMRPPSSGSWRRSSPSFRAKNCAAFGNCWTGCRPASWITAPSPRSSASSAGFISGNAAWCANSSSVTAFTSGTSRD